MDLAGTLLLAPTAAALGLTARAALDRVRELGFRAVQLSATDPGLRPRELGRSARRDLAATIRRRDLRLAGLDLWIPPAHFLDPSRCDRAVSAILDAIDLARDLEGVPVSVSLPVPPEGGDDLLRVIGERACSRDVRVADHALSAADHEPAAGIDVGIDPAAMLASGADPVAAVPRCGHRLAAARLVDLWTSGQRGPVGEPGVARLDVLAYRIALELAALASPVVIDARGWSDPERGFEQSRRVWEG